MQHWMVALSKASHGETEISKYYEMLGLHLEDRVTLAEVNRAFKSTASILSPENIDDILEFRKLQSAFDAITV